MRVITPHRLQEKLINNSTTGRAARCAARISIMKLNFTLYTPSFISQVHLISVLKSVSALGVLLQTSAEMSVLLSFIKLPLFKGLVGNSL